MASTARAGAVSSADERAGAPRPAADPQRTGRGPRGRPPRGLPPLGRVPFGRAPLGRRGRNPDPAELRRVRASQRLAYECSESVAARLRPGVTEREAALMQWEFLASRGVRVWRRSPLAWFGDRTALSGFATPLGASPTQRRLEAGMPFILTMAPVLRGRAAGTGYSGCLGPSPAHRRLVSDLESHRELVRREIRAHRPLGEVLGGVARLTSQQGYASARRTAPFGLRIRRAGRAGPWPSTGEAGRFRKTTDHPARPGLWAVESHLGFRGIGASFEEVLVVTDSRDQAERAFWLDDDLPHVRRWQEDESG